MIDKGVGWDQEEDAGSKKGTLIIIKRKNT